ncbi:MAG: 4Fe-4S cluster-binding domain-containing protein [Desulfatitalea sp.]|nr:4Fe-4S cluster-binding domain-containing protein [Desulfatitalea sp.]
MKNSRFHQTVADIKKEGIPVIIFGASTVGEALFHECRKYEIKVECFCDNNLQKAKMSLCNTKVIHTSDLQKKYPNAIFLISVTDIRDVVEQLLKLGYSKWYPCSIFLRDYDVYHHKFEVPIRFAEYLFDTCLLCQDNYFDPDKLFIRSVDIIITERCSLKCKDCSNLTQYYNKPKDCNTNDLLKTIDVFCSMVDEVNEFRIIGGEPFMNKSFDIIVNRLIEEPKVKKIVIYTNGTIAPSDEKMECLKNSKVLLMVTDYGKLSKNLNVLIQKLSSRDIAFYLNKAQGWTDCSKIHRHYRSIEGQREIFNNCCAKNTISLSDGKLHRCPFAANAVRLSAVPDFETDYVSLFQENIDVSGMRKKIKDYLFNIEYLETCDFCNGRSFGDTEITPAIQAERAIDYKRFP